MKTAETQSAVQLKTAEIEKISHLEYFNTAVSVDCVIFGYEDKELKVLLIKSDLREFEGMHSLLGDLVRTDEDILKAAYRVLAERTGLGDVYLEQVAAFGEPDRHPSGRVITIAYYSLLYIKNHKLRLPNNELHWHTVSEIKNLAFDHKKILDTSLQLLQEKIMEHPIIFNLLPEKFSLRQLQEVYESILGVELDRRNFRKKISVKDWLVDLNEMESNLSHRPGRLYALKKQSPR